MYKVFIDGSAGTTGLKIVDRLSLRSDISLIKLSEDKRKDLLARKEAINSADVVFLCLPDAAAIESVSLIENEKVKVIDTSTAHRTNPNWEYGFPELSGRRERIKNARFIANPGCHASGFIALVEPLVKAGLIDKNLPLICFSITGYTGGGKKMIAEYEDGDRPFLFDSPRQYGLSQTHKHLPEMKAVCGLNESPIFCPIVADFPQGMEVTVPLFKKDVKGGVRAIKDVYKEIYCGKIVHFDEQIDEGGLLAANAFSGRDDMQISLHGNEDRILLVSRFDNLGKGASGAAIQNMNVAIGAEETAGLSL